MKNYRSIVLASLLLVATSASARADVKDFSNRCSMGALHTCASLQVFTTLNASGGTDVTILVRNLQGGIYDNTGGSVIARIGLVTPSVTGASGLVVTSQSGTNVVGTPSTSWLLRSPGSLGGLIELTAGITNGGPGGIIGCDAPFGGLASSYYQTCNTGWVALSFSTTNAWSANNSDVAFLAMGFANGSTGIECDTDDLPTPRPQCADASLATPEPVTLILLGSGLAGMGGVGLVRRRSATDISTD